jgi:hypothetical protein
MNKNEIIARWMGIRVSNHNGVLYHCDEDGMVDWRNAIVYAPSRDRNDLHSAWEKFRDLKFEDDDQAGPICMHHVKLCASLMWTITNKPITEAFDELCKGIIWAESLKNKEV